MAIIKIVPMPGIPGPTGASAYQIAVTNGFEGTEQEWLDSLGNQNLEGIVTQTWGYPTESSKAIRPELAGEAIALKSSESAAIRWHVRENSPSVVISPLIPTAAVVTPVGDGNYYVDFTINTQDYAPTTSQHYYEVVAPESTDYQGNFLPVSSNTTSLRLLYEADPGVFDATDAEIVQPSVYSQFEVNEDGAYIKIANWTDGPGGYSQSWQFTKEGGIHFPYGPSNNRTGSGDVLRFASTIDQAIITGPEATSANPTAQRLVIAGQDGYASTSGEGGDLYLWAGQGGNDGGSGGDIKVDAGEGGSVTGAGGTVKIRGGYSNDSSNGGFVQITGGGSSSGTGGDIYLTTYNDGNIVLSASGGEFLNDATVPGNQIATLSDIPGGLNTIEDPILKDRISFTDNSDTERMYLEYSGTGATRIVSGDDLSIRSQNGDIILYPGNDNSWGGDGGTGKAYVHWGNDATNAAPENEIATVGLFGDITFNGVQIIGAGTASGDALGAGTMELVPDASLYVNDQYLVIDPTDPNHIHIRAGGAMDESIGKLILGGEKNHVYVSDDDRSVIIRTRPPRIQNSYVNTNEAGNAQFITSMPAIVEVGYIVTVEGIDYEVSAVSLDTPSAGLVTVTATGLNNFIFENTYTFTHEEVWENEWEFNSEGHLYGPAMGGIRLTGIEGIPGNSLYISSGEGIVLSGWNGETDEGVFLNDDTNPGNQIATIAYSREHYTTAATITGAIADMGKLLYANCGDGDMTYLIPDNGDVEFPIGSEIKFATGGDARWFINRENVEGATDLIADGGNGYTAINDPYPYIIPIYSTGTLLKVDTNRWILSGMRLTD